MKAIVVVCVLGGVASADPVREDDVSTQPLELTARGAEVGVEHLVRPHWSGFVFIGLRGAALGDYTSTTYVGGVEARWWKRASMTGFYVAAHLSAGRTSLALSATDAEMGAAWGLEQRADAGWRFTISDRVAIGPTVGLGAHEDLDSRGRLAVYTRPVLGFGLELGFLF